MKYVCINTWCGEYDYSDEITLYKIYNVEISHFSKNGVKIIMNDNNIPSSWRNEDFILCFMGLEDWMEKRLIQCIGY
jgi:hypothetical protein